MPKSLLKGLQIREENNVSAVYARLLRNVVYPIVQDSPETCGNTCLLSLAPSEKYLEKAYKDLIMDKDKWLVYVDGKKTGMDPYTLASLARTYYKRLLRYYYNVSAYVDKSEIESIYNGKNTRNGVILDGEALKEDEKRLLDSGVALFNRKLSLDEIFEKVENGAHVIMRLPGLVGHWVVIDGGLNVVFSGAGGKKIVPVVMDPLEGKYIYDEKINDYIAHIVLMFAGFGSNETFTAIIAEPPVQKKVTYLLRKDSYPG
ncbi:MAG: hypothetical protein M1360_04475 [Candidatus Marsarchaeota archaeon]|nr:hypothetical protein [Candidatus Marsarchaeota archaeon]MCL5419161.1 hypothetical protein [Candidatus Marsarchaeota archaeon]